MTRKGRIAGALVCVGAAALLGACGSSALTTGTLLGGGPAKPKVKSPAEQATDRALHVASTSAKASRCGYVFDPSGVRASYLAYEAQQGTPPEIIARAEKSYDFAHGSIAKSIAGQEDYCSEDQTAVIKRDLTGVLAGSFSPPEKKPEVDVGISASTNQPIDRERLFNPER
jgi:hypothetical protein